MGRIIIILLLISTVTTKAQNFKFGKVSKEEVEEKQHPLEPEANAAVLYKSEEINFDFSTIEGFEQTRKVHERIKIYNKEGYDYATKKLKLYNENVSTRERVIGIKGYTYALKNGKVEKIKLRKENIFENENNEFWATKSFTMPSIEEGCVIEFEYILKTPFMSIDDVIVQYDIPINKIESRIAIPEYFNYNKYPNLKAKIQPELSETKKVRREQFDAKSQGLEFDENIININMNNVASLKDEPYVDNLDNYRGKLALEYAFYRAPNGKVTSYSTTWDKITKNINKSESFGEQIEKSSYYEEDLAKVLKETNSDDEKILAIFDLVKSKVKWNDFIGYKTNDGVKKAYKEGVGNVAEINLILVSMLKKAGIKANPVLISTRDNGVPLFPTRSGFNYVVCAVEKEQGLIYLDATQKNANINILPTRAINWLGRIVREDNTSDWVQLSPKKTSKEIISLNLDLNEDLTETGKLRKRLTDYYAFNYRDDNRGKAKESIIQDIENDNSGLIINEINHKDLDNTYKPITYDYDFTYEGAAEEIAGMIYLSPLAFLISEENPFVQEQRNYPIDFVAPLSSKYIVNINLPEGYVVDALPESASVKFNANAASFTYIAKQVGNKIQIMVDTEINQTLITPDQYLDFKKFYQFLKDKESEKIVLKKA